MSRLNRAASLQARATMFRASVVIGVTIDLLLCAGATANAQSRERIYAPWERPTYRSAPSQRPSPSTRADAWINRSRMVCALSSRRLLGSIR